MGRYMVNYEHPVIGDITKNSPYQWGISDIAQGFWVCELGNIAPPMATQVYWIPPHKVNWVTLTDRKE